MTYAPRQAACQAREALKRALEKKLKYTTATLELAIKDAFNAGHIGPATAIEMHRARRNMNDIADTNSGGNGSKTRNTNRKWLFYTTYGKKKKNSPRHSAAQARAILRERIENLLGYKTSSLYHAINHAYRGRKISKASKIRLHLARQNMNAIIHAKPGSNGSKTPARVRVWRDYI